MLNSGPEQYRVLLTTCKATVWRDNPVYLLSGQSFLCQNPVFCVKKDCPDIKYTRLAGNTVAPQVVYKTWYCSGPEFNKAVAGETLTHNDNKNCIFLLIKPYLPLRIFRGQYGFHEANTDFMRPIRFSWGQYGFCRGQYALNTLLKTLIGGQFNLSWYIQ